MEIEQEVTESEEFTLDWAENALKRLISNQNKVVILQ